MINPRLSIQITYLMTTTISLDMADLHHLFPFILEAYVGSERKRTPKTKLLSQTPHQNITYSG